MLRSNLRNLVLRPDVVQAVKEGKFHVHAVGTIDEGIEVLTGIAAGERSPDGYYPANSINGRVEKTLTRFSEQQKQFSAAGNSQGSTAEKD